MIVKIKFEDLSGKTWSMLFGNSYKDWKDQFEEYLFDLNYWWDSKQMMRCGVYNIRTVESCKDKWIQSGGLKWCLDTNAGKQLKIEAELLKLKKPRKFEDFKFEIDDKKFNFCIKRLDERMRHLQESSQEEIIRHLDNYENYKKQKK